ncbi:MAG: ABC transporter substrate-binding protein [Holosporales bacterium]|jgi:polar amino acid transport system substrate-binding protein|nr:ABC transporter substrate-binding protein [Holosporales bacterium]
MKVCGLLRAFLATALLLVGGCENKKDENVIAFGTSADYPPFEYYENGEMTGFEIDLAKAVAKKLGKKAEIKDMSFSSLFAGLLDGSVDVVIASTNPTEERRKINDFTTPYYNTGLAFVHKSGDKVDTSEFTGVRVACQLGSVQEKWLKKNRPAAEAASIDNVAQSVELIKAGRVDGVIVDSAVAATLCSSNPDLTYVVVEEGASDGDSAMAVKKGSELLNPLNAALKELEDGGELQALKERWKLTGE